MMNTITNARDNYLIDQVQGLPAVKKGFNSSPIAEEALLDVNPNDLLRRADSTIRPNHYRTSSGVELFEVTDDLNFNLGNVVKYVFRAGRKSDNILEDLKKAQTYLQREIERLS